MMRSVLIGLLLAVVVSCSPLPDPFSDKCILESGQNLYNQAHSAQVPWFNVNLDLPPKERWTRIATLYKDQIKGLIDVLKGLATPLIPDAVTYIDAIFGPLDEKLPQPYSDEIKGIAEATGLPVGEIVLYNIFYEIFTVCTSIIAEDPQGKIYHARNLDFGLFLGWDHATHNWAVSSHLRQMVININWVRNSKIVFRSNNFAGFIGIYNGLKPHAFTLTANERFAAQGGYIGILRWLIGLEPNGKWMTWHARETMENAVTYQDAYTRLTTEEILSPVYYILGGTTGNEGVIITRSLNATDLVTPLDISRSSDGWYVLQTNYDQNKPTLFLDDRRTPGRHCMDVLTRQNVNFQGIYNVLSSKTNLNKLTTYTVLMQVDSAEFETHIQQCDNPCWPW